MVLVQALACLATANGFGAVLTGEFCTYQEPRICEAATLGAFSERQGFALVGGKVYLDDEVSEIGTKSSSSDDASMLWLLADSRLRAVTFQRSASTKQWVEGRQISLEQCKLVLDRMLPVCGYPLTARIEHSRPSGPEWSLSWRPEHRGIPFAAHWQMGHASLDCETGRPIVMYFPTLVWPPDDLEATVTPDGARSIVIAEAFKRGTFEFDWKQEPIKAIGWKDDKDAPDRHAWKDLRWEDCPRGIVVYEAFLEDRQNKTRGNYPLQLNFHVDAKTGAVLRVLDNQPD